MKQESIAYLKKIIDTPSPSGYEEDAQNAFMQEAESLNLPVEKDCMGNVVVHIASIGKPKILISAHIDEIGFAIKYIDDLGFIYLVPVGGVDKMLLPGSRVLIKHQGKHYLGVCGRKPIHLLSEQERNRFDWDDLCVDCGFTSQRHALEHLNIGDPVVFNTDYTEMTETLVVTRSADNKVGNAILVELMRWLIVNIHSLKYDVYLASTVQEEIGLRGSMVTAFNVRPEISIVIDAAHATDYPACNNKQQGNIKLGKGPVIAFSPDTTSRLANQLIKIAEDTNLFFQRDVYPNASGTEAKAIQIQCGGICTATISYPVRYMHSQSEIFSLEDIDSLASILEYYLVEM